MIKNLTKNESYSALTLINIYLVEFIGKLKYEYYYPKNTGNDLQPKNGESTDS